MLKIFFGAKVGRRQAAGFASVEQMRDWIIERNPVDVILTLFTIVVQ
jgi:hypothetical protein